MSKLKDLTGQKFGRLTVMKQAESKSGNTRWLCQCECGNPKLIFGTNLMNNSTKSCGCLRMETSTNNIKIGSLKRRKHFGCMICGSDKHYAKGYCRNCYNKHRRLEQKYQKERMIKYDKQIA